MKAMYKVMTDELCHSTHEIHEDAVKEVRRVLNETTAKIEELTAYVESLEIVRVSQ